MTLNNVHCSNPTDICNHFGKFFENVYVKENSTFSFDINSVLRNNINLNNYSVSFDQVLEALYSLDEQKSCGPDTILLFSLSDVQ